VRILELGLVAFGSFEGRSIPLDDPPGALQIVAGDNEAGKSTALRALLGALYGIPASTPDAHRHEPSALRVRLRLSNDRGEQIVAVRRKGNKATLLDSDGRPIADDALAPFLGGVGGESFALTFGLDHARLVAGGQALLHGQGAVGESLFEAGLGLDLERVLEDLDAEASALYKPRGVHPAINRAAKGLLEAEARAQKAALLPESWRALDQELATELELRRRLNEERTDLAKKRARFAMLVLAKPKAERRRELAEARRRLGEVPNLLPDAAEARRSALRRREHAHKSALRAETERAELESKRAALSVPAGVLEHEPLIAELNARRSTYLRAVEALPKRGAESARLEAEAKKLAAALWPELPFDTARERKVPKSLRARIEETARRLAELTATRERLREELAAADKEKERLARDLEALPPERDPTPLRLLLREAERDGDLDQKLADHAEQIAGLEKKAALEMDRLGLWRGSIDAIDQLLRPPTEAIERFRVELDGLALDGRRIDAELSELEERAGPIRSALGEIEAAGSLAAEADLLKARQERDLQWHALRAAIDKPRRTGALLAELAEAFQASAERVDRLADAFLAEAERFARRGALERERAALLERRSKLESEQASSAERLAGALERWRRAWEVAGIAPLSPEEMLGWVRKQESLAALGRSLRELKKERARLEERLRLHRKKVDAARAPLSSASPPRSGGLAAAIEHAFSVASDVDEANHRRRALEGSIQKLARSREDALPRLSRVEEERSSWSVSWTESMHALGLGPDAMPAQASRILDLTDELTRRLDESGALLVELLAQQEERDAFRAGATQLAEALGPALDSGAPPEQTVAAAQALLVRAQRDLATRLQLEERVRDLLARAQEAEQERAAAEQELLDLMHNAGASDLAALERAEQRWSERSRIEAELGALEAQLGELARGEGLPGLLAELEGKDATALSAELERLSADAERIEQEIGERDRRIGRQRTLLGELDGRDEAARAAEEAAALAAEARRALDRYLLLRLSSAILRRHIERYRKANQVPLLARAGQIFTALTQGAYLGLDSELDDTDRPVLVACRSAVLGGARVRVAGLSDGTRDQLFLSLRLASIERFVEAPGQERLPLILDDVLLNFDDARSAAALLVLAELASKTQVILFTHHSRLVELARQALPAPKLAAHVLGLPRR
jgi:uncharacterized protein YhaN